ncbi:MAG: DUF4232 domain-containing protein [Gemmatimonadales bacterium]
MGAVGAWVSTAKRRGPGTIAFCVVLFAVSGCDREPQTRPSASASATPSARASASGGAASPSQHSTDFAKCTASAVELTMSDVAGLAGRSAQEVTVRNRGDRVCGLVEYARIFTSTGASIHVRTDRDIAGDEPVSSLAPGGTALVRWWQQSDCGRARSRTIRVSNGTIPLGRVDGFALVLSCGLREGPFVERTS